MSNLVPAERIENKIYLIRGQKVMLDHDLAELYGVTTRNLKRQVRRNRERFPADFMFVLSGKEIREMVCHFGTPLKSRFGGAKPFAFTDYGILMLSSVLTSKRAIQVNIKIMRIFARLKHIAVNYKEFSSRLSDLERKVEGHGGEIKAIFDAIRKMLAIPERPSRKIGFLVDKD